MDIFNMGGKGKKKGKKKSKRAAPLPAASTVKKTKTSHKVVAGGKTDRGLKAGGGKQDVVGGGKAITPITLTALITIIIPITLTQPTPTPYNPNATKLTPSEPSAARNYNLIIRNLTKPQRSQN